jgi:hypothetical protein
MRRLSLMLEYLIANLPPERARCLQQQLDLLRLSVEKTFFDPRDRVDAEIADSQGLGGAVGHANGTSDWIPSGVPRQSESSS